MSLREARANEFEDDPFDKLEDNLSDEWIKKAEDYLGEIQSLRPKYLEEFKEIIEKDRDLKVFKNIFDEKNLTRFMRAANWNVKAAVELLRSFWPLWTDSPEVLQVCLPSKLCNIWEKNLISCNPKRDSLGRRIVILHKFGNWDPAKIPPNEYLATATTGLEMISREPKSQIAGVIVVLNVDGFSFKHLRYMGVQQIKVLAALLNGAVPLWFRKIHIVNPPRVFNVFFGLIKPFLNERIQDNIVFHSNQASLHTYVRPELLPAELGGCTEIKPGARAATQRMEAEFSQYVNLIKIQEVSSPVSGAASWWG